MKTLLPSGGWPRWAGTLRTYLKAALALTLFSAALFLAALHLLPLPDRLAPPVSTVVTYEDGTIAHVFLADDGRWRIAADHRQIDPAYLEALLALEDKRFFTHRGVDPQAIIRAFLTNASRGRVVSGASTLTMQVVRMAEPRPRTMRSKLVEAFRAFQVEQHYSKEEILDIYLTLLPFGRNYEGLETASYAYFGHDASLLTPAEIATLLAVPQAPASRHPRPENLERLRNARNDIAARLYEVDALPRGLRSERLTKEQALEAIALQTVPELIAPMPREIPHLAYQLRSEHPEELLLKTTVNRQTQRIAQSMVTLHEEQIRRSGAEHTAVVVMDYKTGELKALVGSFDYFDHSSGVKIPAYNVPRSTGSLLKPFLFARGIDKGQASPSHLVEDAPVNYSGYRPINFDGTFSGLVRLEDALSRSLNIPFVQLLEQIGIDDFLLTLERLGLELDPVDAQSQGLSLAVGGLSISPVEVASLYSALARSGDALSPTWYGGQNPSSVQPPTRGGLSAESAYLTREVLQRRGRPGFPGRGHHRLQDNPYAWKTGTSMGFRDAWTAGIGPRYVVVVWTGNLDWRPGRYLVGEAVAAPLFFDLIEAIDPPRQQPRATAPQGLDTVEVCAFSGHLPTAACEHTREVQMPRQSIATRRCPYHIHLDIDVQSGMATNRACQDDGIIESRSFLRLPPSVEDYFTLASGQGRQPPPFAPHCRNHGATQGPRLVSPAGHLEIALIPGLPLDSQMIPLEARAETATVSFFINGRLFGRAAPGERLWWTPEPGHHDIVAMDSEGRTDKRGLRVRAPGS